MISCKFILAFLGFLHLFGFSSQAAPGMPLPNIDAEIEEDGMVDLVFSIQEVDFQKDGSCKLKALGEYKKEKVGFSVLLSFQSEVHQLKPPIAGLKLYRAKVLLGSLGKESDQFLKALKELYQIGWKTEIFKKEVQFTALTLQGNPANIKSEELKIKLFYENDPEAPEDGTRYAEFFINIDLPHSKLYLREKDEEYREPIVRALGQ